MSTNKPLVFISWSGDRGRAVANALADWLPCVLQSIEVWCSDSTDAGKFWNLEIADRLNRARVGIIVVTPESQAKPWLLFESGAVAKSLISDGDETRAIPFLVGMPVQDLSPPLALLQAVSGNKAGALSVVKSVNRTLADPLVEDRLNKLFDALYGDLEAKIKAAEELPVAEAAPKRRDSAEMLAEILGAIMRLEGSIGRQLRTERVLDLALRDRRPAPTPEMPADPAVQRAVTRALSEALADFAAGRTLWVAPGSTDPGSTPSPPPPAGSTTRSTS